MMISVVIPTVPGREDVFQWTCAAYMAGAEDGPTIEIIVEAGHPTVGCAWQAGADKARGEYIHLGNDDCEPHPDWWQPAIEACDLGYLPSPLVFAPDGTPQGLPEWGRIAPDWTEVSCCLIPFMSRAQWQQIRPLLLTHYHSDNWITDRAAAAGWPCVLRTAYSFTHHWAQPGRGAGMTEDQRMAYDEALFKQAKAMEAAGNWLDPWPPRGESPGLAEAPPFVGGGPVPRLEGDDIVKAWRYKGP